MSGHFQKHLKLAIYNICTQIQKPDIVSYSILYFTMGADGAPEEVEIHERVMKWNAAGQPFRRLSSMKTSLSSIIVGTG